jgi:hypothetical protein
MSSRAGQEKPRAAPHKKENRPYDNRPRSGPDQAKRRTRHDGNAVRVVMPDEPPQLNPEAARVLLRILLKAYDRLNAPDNPYGGDAG